MRLRPFSAFARLRRANGQALRGQPPQGCRNDFGAEGAEGPFLDPARLQQGLATLATLLGRQPVALVGGVAGAFFGTGRLTGDIDVLAMNPLRGIPDHGPLALEVLQGYKSEVVLPDGSRVAVDVLLPDATYKGLVFEALRDARTTTSSVLPVVSPHHFVALKMLARRGKDEGDIAMVVTKGLVDMTLARKVVARHLGSYAVEELDAIVAFAKWQASGGGKGGGGKGLTR